MNLFFLVLVKHSSNQTFIVIINIIALILLLLLLLLFIFILILPMSIMMILAIRPLVYLIPKYLKWEPAIISFYFFVGTGVFAALSVEPA